MGWGATQRLICFGHLDGSPRRRDLIHQDESIGPADLRSVGMMTKAEAKNIMHVEQLTKADQKLYQRAQEYSLAGEHAKVIGILTRLVYSYPSLGMLRGALANSLWELDEVESAIHEFRTAIDSSPSLEVLSLGLFHCLWDLGRVDDAFSEMNRYLSKYESKDYRAILNEIDERNRLDSDR